VDADPKKISDTFYRYNNQSPVQFPAIFGDGHAAEFILNELVKFLP
jgi:hypothetical protein